LWRPRESDQPAEWEPTVTALDLSLRRATLRGMTARGHYVPKMLLRRFADDREHLSAYDLKTGKTLTPSIDGVAAEMDFYHVELPDGSTDAYLEDQLAAVEGEVAATLRAIIDRKSFPPSSDDRLVLACFVALQFLRTARIRGWLNELADAASAQRPHGNAHLQLMLELLPKATNRLIAMRLVIVRYKRQRLLTCDSPVVLHSEPIDGSFPTGVGLLNADEVWLSVSCDVAVCFTDRVPRDAELPPNASGAHWLNLMTAHHARRWIFHHPEDSPLRPIDFPAWRATDLDLDELARLADPFADFPDPIDEPD